MYCEDRFGLMASSCSREATRAFEEAVQEVGAHRPKAGVALAEALRHDPDHVAAHALKGFANLILAREELEPVATQVLGEAKAALARRDGGSADERVLVAALELAAAGRFRAAAERLDAGFSARPATFLPFKLAHALRFMAGDAPGMLAASRRMLSAWSEDNAAAGFLLGCHAFGLEESGAYREAEATGRRAVALQPEDAWGMHAVGHVHEMEGNVAAGIRWLEGGRADWSRCNNFSFHMAWHLGLLHLERGDHDAVLAIYDREVRPEPTDDFRDVANAVSLLWRLECSDVDVGARWDELATIARRRAEDTTLVFASLHYLLALVASGDDAAAEAMRAALARKAQGEGDQSDVAAGIGLPLAEAILALRSRAARPRQDARAARTDFAKLLRDLPRLGGSNAQRDVFVLTLANFAAETGDALLMARIRRVRRRLKAEDALLEAAGRGLRRTG